MNPLLLSALMQGGGTLLGGLLGSRQSREAQRKQREYRSQMMRLASPEYMRKLQSQFYDQSLAGPGMTHATRGIFNAGAGMTNRLQGSMAARGLSGSGVGAIGSALAGSATGGMMGKLRSDLYGQAGQMAGSMQGREMDALQGLGQPQSYNYGSQAVGGGLADFGRWYTENMGKKK